MYSYLDPIIEGRPLKIMSIQYFNHFILASNTYNQFSTRHPEAQSDPKE